jgi:prophage regulatory protein
MPTKQLLRLNEVIELVRLSRDSIYRLAKLGKFPKPVKIGIKVNAWRVSEVQEWIDSRKHG